MTGVQEPHVPDTQVTELASPILGVCAAMLALVHTNALRRHENRSRTMTGTVAPDGVALYGRLETEDAKQDGRAMLSD